MASATEDRERLFDIALTNACLLAIAKGFYDPANPTGASEKTLFFIWEHAISTSLPFPELQYFKRKSAVARRMHFPTESPYSYARFQQEFLRKARRHENIVLN